MKIGLGLYRQMLNRDHFRFARQAGCTHVVAHLLDYRKDQFLDPDRRPPDPANPRDLWTEEQLTDLKTGVNAEGLVLEAIENFEPAHWSDILLDGPRKIEQIEDIKTMIRRVGKVGIPIIGYDFSIAGVWGHIQGSWARGGATALGFSQKHGPRETLIPKGEVWNVIYDPEAPSGDIGEVTSEQIWMRYEEFLKAVVPVAEEAGVRLAAHADDPPLPTLRGTARLVYQPHMYQRVLDIVPSTANALEICMGTTQTMTEGDIYDVLATYSRKKAIAYVHFRNVRGQVPEYREVFLDEGDIDMVKALRVLHDNGYDGLLVPDHTPHMTCSAPWHAGMTYALGYMQAALRIIETGG
ncbi:MAG: TIM barrel protein [Phycisphaerales bacterium]|nr:TIM barrel protein [Phycisphaerales bacterium]